MSRVLLVFGAAGAIAGLAAIGCGATKSEPRDGHANALVGDVGGASKATARTAEGVDTSSGFLASALGTTAADEARGGCRPGMVSIDGRYCIDRYEASLVEVMPTGEERPFSPYATVSDQHVRAVSQARVYPQGYISRNQAERACVSSGKRLCRVQEWQQACRGPENKRYGYGERHEPGQCNDNGKNPVRTLYGPRYDATTMNQPQLNQMSGTLAKTGEHAGCSNGYGVYDMVGNLHEWASNGSFYGGYYREVASFGHGDGCSYQTSAHEARYHDYSTGFRCCADLAGLKAPIETAPTKAPAKPRARPKPQHGKHR